jgi:hypothetical protein
MDFHEISQEQCKATRTIRQRFGIKNALVYLVGEKLLNFRHGGRVDEHARSRNLQRVPLSNRSGFDMLLAFESDMVGTRPYPHNSSSKVATAYCNVLAIQCLRTATASPST